jgi:hypothetical protein
VTEYRLYQIKEKHIAGPPTVIEADGDRAAIELARQLPDGCDAELWEGSRFVIGLRSRDSVGVAMPDHPNCPTCDVPMWLVKVQLGDAIQVQEFQCQVCYAKLSSTRPREHGSKR